MDITNAHVIEEYADVHRDVAKRLKSWIVKVRSTRWRTPLDARLVSSDVTSLGHNRLLFDILYNRYRLVVRVDYENGTVEVRFIGTHKEYDRINVMEV